VPGPPHWAGLPSTRAATCGASSGPHDPVRSPTDRKPAMHAAFSHAGNLHSTAQCMPHHDARVLQPRQVRGVCVVLPPGATFVIANSLAVSNKAETAPKRSADAHGELRGAF
jgi:hypothetical protein